MNIRRKNWLTGPPKALPLLLVLLAFAPEYEAADRCADARDDIRRAMGVAEAGKAAQARRLLRAALLACLSKPQNLDLLADAYDLLGGLQQAGMYREQAMRISGVSAKPVVKLVVAQEQIERGQTTILKWETTYATEVEIDPGIGRVSAKGSETIAPLSVTSYRLTARGPGGTTSASVQVVVTLSRLTVSDIVYLLEHEVPKTRIAKLVIERGIAFDVSPSVQTRLESAGADDQLMNALKQAPH